MIFFTFSHYLNVLYKNSKLHRDEKIQWRDTNQLIQFPIAEYDSIPSSVSTRLIAFRILATFRFSCPHKYIYIY